MTHQIMIHSQKSDFESLNSESWMIGLEQITVPVRLRGFREVEKPTWVDF